MISFLFEGPPFNVITNWDPEQTPDVPNSVWVSEEAGALQHRQKHTAEPRIREIEEGTEEDRAMYPCLLLLKTSEPTLVSKHVRTKCLWISRSPEPLL